MKYPKKIQYKYAKSQYRVWNWPEYEAGLRRCEWPTKGGVACLQDSQQNDPIGDA
jgi:hypothetical protein